MPEDRALNMSDYIGRMVARSIVDQGLNQSDNVVVSGTASGTSATSASAIGTTAAGVSEVVIRDDQGRTIQFGLDQDRAMWVGFVTALGVLYDMLTSNGVPSTQAMLIVGAVAGFCLAHLAD